MGIHIISIPSRKLFHGRARRCHRSMLPYNAGHFNLATNLPVSLVSLINANNRMFNLRSFNFSTPCGMLSRGLNFAPRGITRRVHGFLGGWSEGL